MKKFVFWELKKEKNVINGKEYDLVLYYNNKWHTIIKSDEIDISSILSTISLEMQDDQLKVMTKGFELLSKEVLEKVKPKLLEELPKPLKQQLFIEN